MRISVWEIAAVVLAMLVVVGVARSQEFPDNPQPQSQCRNVWINGRETTFDCNPTKAGFWTVGRWDSPKPLRTNREVFRSRSFWLEELALYGSTYAEVAIARSGRQNPPVPKGWDLGF